MKNARKPVHPFRGGIPGELASVEEIKLGHEEEHVPY